MAIDDSQASLSSQADPKKSPTFGRDGSFHVAEAVGSASISPSGRDIALGSPEGLHIIDLDNPWSPPRTLSHRQPWEVADVQWSPFAARDYWVVSTSGQKALVWNLDMPTTKAPIQHVLHGHSRAITDINFSAHDPDLLATCSIDSFVQCWDLRIPPRPAMTFADWYAGASQVKWNRQESHILASAHDRFLHIWDTRKESKPLRTLYAHSTKIYGIDWNRINAKKILTCSLDMSIKLWNYGDEETPLTRTINTPYPVWRARHTPCGDGILAMPQRGGNNALHLYTVGGVLNSESQTAAKPVKTFLGHTSQVKEFLWRTQGSVKDGLDERDFQLVSWGTDNNLLLHRVDDDVLSSIDYRKGNTKSSRIRFTRHGATYRTFHEPPAPKTSVAHGLSSLFKNPRQAGFRAPLGNWGRGTSSKYEERSSTRKGNTDPISWMKSVKIGASLTKEVGNAQLSPSGVNPADTIESLADEISHAGAKYKNVHFEEVKIPERKVTLSLDGPWGLEGSLTYIKISVSFPEGYPGLASPGIIIENTPSAPNTTLTKIIHEVRSICDAYSDIGRGSLEPLICYLIGDWDVDAAIDYAGRLQVAMQVSLDKLDGDSSSDEDDDFTGRPDALVQKGPIDGTEAGIIRVKDGNANVPLPKACGALWADDGRLVCFFAQRAQPDLLSWSRLPNNMGNRARPRHAFDGFGVFGPTKGYARTRSTSVSSESNSDSDDTASTEVSVSSGRSDTSEPLALGTHLLQGATQSLAGSIDKLNLRKIGSHAASNAPQIVSLQMFDDLLPAKRSLAERYIIFGNSTEVCRHNEAASRELGYGSLGDIWALFRVITLHDVPLTSSQHPSDSADNVLVAAKRALKDIEFSKSALPEVDIVDCASTGRTDLRGAVHWHDHPFGPEGIVDKLFEHCEALADIQMLAMLSCILTCRPIDGDPAGESIEEMDLAKFTTDLMPGQTHLYHDSDDILLATLRPPEITLYDPAGAHDTGMNGFEQQPSSSFGSDVAISDSDATGSRRGHANQSTDSTSFELRRTSSHVSIEQSGSVSPEQTFLKRSQSMLSTRIAASLSRPFSFMTSASASPPSQSPTPELPTSVPSPGPDATSNSSLGRHSRSFDDSSSLYRVGSRSSLGREIDVQSMHSSDDEDSESDDDWEAVVVLDDKTAADAGELQPQTSSKYELRYADWIHAYAHLLFVWQMPYKRAEVLKFVGERAPRGTEVAADTGSQRVICTICHDVISGLASSCLQCRHAAHIECLDSLADGIDEGFGCSYGCLCACGSDYESGYEDRA